MTRNQLPEGVGKKIVEALKRQTEADITPVDAEENLLDKNIPLTDIQDVPDLSFDSLEENETTDNLIVEEDTPVVPQQEPEKAETVQPQPSVQDVMNKPVFSSINDLAINSLMNNNKNEASIATANISMALPQNVAILRNLIASLPVGVSKQTGAQIIRQTLEAMGLPMNSVLKEAQEIQEQLNTSTRECLLKIQEYKTNILQLEQSVQEYQKHMTQINDLVSLFLLTDKK